MSKQVPTQATQPTRIAICGAGIGGLTLALTLGMHSAHQVDMYEAGAQISTTGAGISVWARTFEVLQLLGLEERLRERNMSLDSADESQRIRPKFRRSDQTSPGYNFLTDALSKGGITMHRPDLVDLLKDNLSPSCSIHLQKRMWRYTTSPFSSPQITLHFTDGTTSTADVLVGADGVHSATRKTMFDALAHQYPQGIDGIARETLLRCKEPVWTGTVAYRCVFPAERLKHVDPRHPVLEDQIIHIVSYPIAQRTLINFVGLDTTLGAEGTQFSSEKWIQDVPVEEIRALYRDWELDVQTLLKCADTPSRWAIHTTAPLPFYAHDNVALLGDAAHAMTPHFGAAAGQAIESAYILGRVLSHPSTTRTTAPAALKVYSAIRQPFANRIAEKSRLVGLLYDFSAPGMYDGGRGSRDDRNEGAKEAVGLQDDWRRAEMMLSHERGNL